ncbi:50S ribosomal protein L21 [Brasilonema bromeliae]|uniref:Large ribosomal subunit protein bL21 n=1 Tax=Brasilonema bromeliae SPC951 TaxID=385972 RepID=A0ABX1PEC5_9CYAN|nr:50S ribosomal protein L21 [Brasilonema bromeliae]NMG22844.1 50S ribosomal protein L21 [Brasilonema bromeliae SPC951]
MTYAIIETGGKQVKVEAGRFYDIELLCVEPDEKVTIDKVLLVQHNGEVTIGQPLVGGAKVEGTVMRHLRGRKVLVYKMKPKKKTRKKRGHRQEITRLLINSISLDGSVLASEENAISVTPEASVTTVPAATTETPETVDVVAEPVAENSPAEETPAE